MNTPTLTAATRPSVVRCSRRVGEQGIGRVALLTAIAVIAVAAAVVFWRSQPGGRSAPAETAIAPSASTPPSPTQASSSAVALSAATTTGADSDPAFQKPAVATDPTFKEARGQLLPTIPSVPAYPGATLVGSAEQSRAGEPAEGYRVKWTTRDSVPTVMQWYQKTLPGQGWSYTPPDDGPPSVEQLARISKGDLTGYVAAEATGDVTEIVVSLKSKSR